MAIKLDKILTISPTEWFAMNGKNPSNYAAKGVHYVSGTHDDSMDKFADLVPEGAEVVLSYRDAPSYNIFSKSGTALIPKRPVSESENL